ncbi:MAG: N-acetyltransferase family protein [bacterium]|jgi:phosphinothricin acetyltransferase|nr:N-acetyltransferase family protein [bacterium]
MLLRIATEDDYNRIVEIYNQAVDDGFCTADTNHVTVEERMGWFRQHHSEKYPIFVAVNEGTVTGWCSLSPYRPGRKALRTASEISYYIDRNYRKQGIGGRLIRHTLRQAPEFGFKNIFAILLDVNENSIRLLEKNGFVQWGHLPEIADFDGKRCGQFIYGRKV